MAVPKSGKFFLEVFVGEAVLTRAMSALNFPVLPPIELTPNEFVRQSTDVTDAAVVAHVQLLMEQGFIFYIHFGTPCSSFSLARKNDGGPPPLRSQRALWSLPHLSVRDQAKLEIGNHLMQLTVKFALIAHRSGTHWSIENPLGSYLWAMPPMVELHRQTSSKRVEFDMCRFGAPHLKPTALLTSLNLDQLAQRCDQHVRPHHHEALHGTVIVQGKQVFRTRLAQVYPAELCRQWAVAAVHPEDPLALTFTMVTPASERKRPLGQPVPWRPHRQQLTAEKATSAGYQLKRSALPPLLDTELEPGTAVQQALNTVHPFSRSTAIEPDLQEPLALAVYHPEWLRTQRARALLHWEARAHQLLPATDAILRAIPDTWLRHLLRGGPDDRPLQLGSCTHVALWQALMVEARSIDTDLVAEMKAGMSIVEDIHPAHRWAPYDKPRDCLPIDKLKERAWEFRQKVLRNVLKREVSPHTQKVWDAMLEDVQEGLTMGPFFTQEEVSKLVGDPWIPTQRFEVVQKNKVRGVDSATVNGINKATKIVEMWRAGCSMSARHIAKWLSTRLIGAGV